VAGAAFAEAKKNNWRMAFTIVGPAGEPIYFEKMDGTQHASLEISRAKARTAVFFRRPTKAFADQFAAGNTTFMTFPDAPIASEGGVLIVLNGKIVRRSARAAEPGNRTALAAARRAVKYVRGPRAGPRSQFGLSHSKSPFLSPGIVVTVINCARRSGRLCRMSGLIRYGRGTLTANRLFHRTTGCSSSPG
jgi:hypothetical protein